MLTYFSQHPLVLTGATAVTTWIFNNIITVMITSLPAPTSTSSTRYVYWFKVLNTVIGNLQRAKSTAVEGSPNWQAAMQKATNGNAQAPVTPPPNPPAGG